jgi:hypothetical protein
MLEPAEGPAMIEAFFADSRNLERLGFEPPLWRRFIAFIPRTRAASRVASSPVTEEMAESEIEAALARLRRNAS